MRILIPHQIAVLPGRVLQRGRRRLRVAVHHGLPVAESHVDVRRHVERVRIVRRHFLVVADDVQRLPLAPGDVVGMDEVVQRARMIRILLQHRQEDRGRAIGVAARHGVGRCGREEGERGERGHILVVRVAGVRRLHAGAPARDARPVVGVRIAVERHGGVEQ